MDNIPPDIPQKQCAGTCEQWLPATPSFFSRNKNRPDGLQTLCKLCMSNYKKQHYKANKERISKQHKAYSATHKEQQRERMERYMATHREDYLSYHKEYYIDRRDQTLEQMKHHYAMHNERIRARVRRYEKTPQGRRVARAHWHRYRAQKKANGGSYTAQDIQSQYERQRGKCYWCHKKLVEYHIDHVMPLSRGGSNAPDNIVIACPLCNMQKHDKLPHEWPNGGRLL